jgi:hypothetical protein
MRRLDPSLASGSEEFLDTSMPEALDHVYSGARHASEVKQKDIERS